MAISGSGACFCGQLTSSSQPVSSGTEMSALCVEILGKLFASGIALFKVYVSPFDIFVPMIFDAAFFALN